MILEMNCVLKMMFRMSTHPHLKQGANKILAICWIQVIIVITITNNYAPTVLSPCPRDRCRTVAVCPRTAAARTEEKHWSGAVKLRAEA